MQKKNYIDIAKGIGIILVILGHSGVNSEIKDFIYGFHMPLFFVISGYLYNVDKWNSQGIASLIKAKSRAYLIPYFILSFINLLINIPLEYYNDIRGNELFLSTAKHCFWILYSASDAKSTPNCSPLWFLTTLFLSYILFFYLLKIRNRNIIFLIFISATTVLILIHKINLFSYMPWHLEAAIIGTFIMYAGLLIKKYNLLDLPINLLGIIAIIIIGSYAILKNDAVSMPHNNVSNPILFYVGSLLLSYSIFWISAKLIVKNSFLSYFGNNTLLVMGFNYAINSYSKIVW